MKLELKHLAAYLPYGLKIFNTYSDKTEILLSCNKEMITLFGNYKTISSQYMYSECKPVLRPLSDLTKEIEVNGQKFVPSKEYHYLRFDEISNYKGGSSTLGFIQAREQDILLEWHFDIFGLIDNNLAININDNR